MMYVIMWYAPCDDSKEFATQIECMRYFEACEGPRDEFYYISKDNVLYCFTDRPLSFQDVWKWSAVIVKRGK